MGAAAPASGGWVLVLVAPPGARRIEELLAGRDAGCRLPLKHGYLTVASETGLLSVAVGPKGVQPREATSRGGESRGGPWLCRLRTCSLCEVTLEKVEILREAVELLTEGAQKHQHHLHICVIPACTGSTTTAAGESSLACSPSSLLFPYCAAPGRNGSCADMHGLWRG